MPGTSRTGKLHATNKVGIVCREVLYGIVHVETTMKVKDTPVTRLKTAMTSCHGNIGCGIINAATEWKAAVKTRKTATRRREQNLRWRWDAGNNRDVINVHNEAWTEKERPTKEKKGTIEIKNATGNSRNHR